MKQETLIKLKIITSQSLWLVAETVHKKGIKPKNKNLHLKNMIKIRNKVNHLGKEKINKKYLAYYISADKN